ncbi:hypothetical protein ALP46_200301 [Pseudomonas amygdali pv. myricae]|nr:hypothetical protein ALP46_200301 [Pseudomonas amygdali pv. myricae]
MLYRKYLLLHSLDGNVMSTWSGGRLAYSFGIDEVILVARHVGLHMLRSNQLHPVPQRGERPGKPVRATARLHCNGAGFNLSRKLQKAIAIEALA